MFIDLKLIGRRIWQRRKELSLSQKQLADRLNISNNHLSNIENGKSAPSFELFLNICSELDTSYDYLIIGTIHPDLTQSLIEKIRLCSDEDKIKLSKIVDVFLENR